MIYLDNSTSGQTIYIPRNDLDFIPQKPTDLEGKKVTIDMDITYVYPSSGFIGMSSVTINAEAYAQRNYDDGFDDGFLDGMSSGYTDGYTSGYTSGSTDGFNSGYTSGQTDGFQSGYTSGETHQKSLLASTALTENGTYTREDGWNEVEVSVDTGSTYESGYTSGYTDGFDSGYTSGYTDGYDSGYTSGNTDGYASGETVGYESGYTEGYASGNTDGFASGYTSGHTDGENAIIDTFTAMSVTENGQYGSSAHPLSSITVNVPQTGVSIPLSSITINSNTAITVNDVAYTGITVNVPLVYFDDYIHTNPLHSVDNLDYLIDTNIIPTTGTTMRVKGMNMGIWNGDTIAGDDERPYPTFRGFWTNNKIWFDWNTYYEIRRIYNSWTGNSETNTGNTIDVTFGNYYIYDNVAEEMIATGSTVDVWTFNRSIKVNVGSWWLKEFEIWDGETKVFDGVAAHNSNGEIGLYDRISQKMYTNSDLDIVYENIQSLGVGSFSANGTYSASTDNLNGYSALTINVDTATTYQNGYNSGYTDGFSSGYTKGKEDQKYMLAITSFTENGIYTRENGWKKVTVNVDTGATYQSGYTDGLNSFIEYIEGTTRNLTIPSGTTTIRDYAFYSQTYFTGLTLPNSLTSIGGFAFYGCINLTNIYCYAQTSPSIYTNPFQNIASSGTLHHPVGTDYSSFMNYLPIGWTEVADL